MSEFNIIIVIICAVIVNVGAWIAEWFPCRNAFSQWLSPIVKFSFSCLTIWCLTFIR